MFLLLYYLGLFSFSGIITGQDLSHGFPLLRNYTVEEIGGSSQNWKIVQDQRGIIYIANQEGIIEYDGTNWYTIDINGGNPAYAMAIDKEGVIYVGSEGEFGVLMPDKAGILGYYSLLDLLPETEEKYGNRIIQIICADSLVYFTSFYNRITYRPSDNSIEILNSPFNWFSGHIIGDDYYTSSYSNGLLKIENDSIIIMPNTDSLKGTVVVKILQSSDDILLIFTQDLGIYSYHFKTGILTKMEIEEQLYKDITSNILYEVLDMPSGDIELNTLYGGSYILSHKLAVKYHYDRSTGIQDETIISCLVDTDQNIWYSLNSGITKMKHNIPIREMKENYQFRGVIWDISFQDNNLFIATSSGLFLSGISSVNNGPIELLSKDGSSLGQVCTVEITGQQEGTPPLLLAGTVKGLLNINMTKPEWVGETVEPEIPYYFGKIIRSQYDPDLFYGGIYGGIISYNIKAGQIKELNKFVIPNLITNLVETGNKVVWTGLDNGVLKKLDFQKDISTDYNLKDITSDQKNIFFSFFLNDGLLFAFTSAGTYMYSETEDRFLKTSLFDEVEYLENRTITYCTQDSKGNYFISCYGFEEGKKLVYNGMVVSSYSNMNRFIHFAELPSKESFQVLPVNNKVYFAFDKEIYTIDVDRYLNYDETSGRGSFSCLIRKITSSGNQTFFGGYSLEEEIHLEIPYEQRNLNITWSAPYYNHEERTQYRYELSGRKSLKNSTWESNTDIQLLNLPPGKYQFKSEAINLRNEISQPALAFFRILPPWYLKWYMYVLYSIAFLFLIILSIRLYSIKLIRDKNRLENIVTDRTSEIRDQKEIIEHKNTQITDSISYAQRIQQAVLPSKEYLNDIMPEYFVLYKPKDIVSGDFYWIKEVKNKIVIVGADCTGHGVPGAFMSMLGITLLNEQFNDIENDSPGEMLGQLRTKVKEMLAQEGTLRDQKDGLDMVLAIIDNQSMRLQSAGANNPLYLIRSKKQSKKDEFEHFISTETEDLCLYELKGDKQPIGIHWEETEFTSYSVELEKGDTIYLFSDGFVDQYGGDQRKKFKSINFKKLLLSVQNNSMEEQNRHLEEAFESWRGAYDQLDDVLVIGIRV